MKKLALFVMFTLVAFVASAQSPVTFSVKGGVGIANWMGDDVDGAKAKFAYKVGVGMECPFDQTWSLQTGLNFVSKGAKGDGEFGNVSGNLTVNELYLELPVMAAARFAVDNTTNIVVSAGPYLAYGVGGKVKAEAEESGIKASVEADTFGDKGADIRRFDYGLGIGVAAEFGQIVVGLDGQFGLNKLQKDVKASNLSAFLTVGYKF